MIEQPSAPETPSSKFAKGLQTLHAHNCSFTACVRVEYEHIEQAVTDGIPLEKIARALSDAYGIDGSLSALKSALRRLRIAKAGYAQQKWLNENAPVSSTNSRQRSPLKSTQSALQGEPSAARWQPSGWTFAPATPSYYDTGPSGL